MLIDFFSIIYVLNIFQLAKKCRTRYTVPVWAPVYTYAFFAPSQGKFMSFFELIDLNEKYDDENVKLDFMN